MQPDNQHFLNAQIHAMQKAFALSLEGDEQAFYIKWIAIEAKVFRDTWSVSSCCTCFHVDSCECCLKLKCDKYKERNTS